jgi:sigma-B regulation protein RsbU (phosphoserine phosphatase)
MSEPKESRRETTTLQQGEDCSPEDGVTCLLAATRELSSASELIEGLENVADQLQQFINYDTFAVLLLDDLGRELHFEFARGFPSEVQKHWRFGLGQGIVGTVAQTHQPLLVGDVQEDDRYIHASDLVRSELALPLTTPRRTIGVLDIGSTRKNQFTKDHLRLLSSLADHLASAIENSRLYQNMREQAQTLSLLHEMSRELASILDRKRLLERVAEVLEPLIDFDIFSVLLWNEHTRMLEPWATIYHEELGYVQARSVDLGEGICGTAAALRQSIRVANVELDPRYVSCFEDLNVRSELTVPLIFKDRLIGVIDLESFSYDAFGSRHEQLLSTVASSLAIALENARLYEELSESEARLEKDLTAAREIQRQLLPKRTPWLPGVQIAVRYEAARHLAGDFYDFLPCGENCVAIAVADVAGKSTSAALYGSLAAGMLREYLGQNPPHPATVLRDLNSKLRELAIDNRFLAMAFAVYNGDSGTVSLANSGLPHPYLLRGRSLQRLSVEGVPLGLLPDRTYDALRLELEPGDALVISSDGIEESLDAQEQEFGRQRVEDTLRRLAHLPAEELADGLVAAASRFSASDEASDDRTVVVLKVVGD